MEETWEWKRLGNGRGRLVPACGCHSACICEVSCAFSAVTSVESFCSSSPVSFVRERSRAMTNFFDLPHEKLYAYQEARKLLGCMREACITDGKLREQGARAAMSVCLNIAEGCG